MATLFDQAAKNPVVEMSHTPISKRGRVHIVEAVESVRSTLLSQGLADTLDDLAIASRFPAIIAALIVASAIDELRREVAE